MRKFFKSKFRKYLVIFTVFLLIIFTAQNRIFNEADKPKLLLVSNYKSSADFEKELKLQSKKCENCIIPKNWYGKKGFLIPSVAGMLDGAYEIGISLKELSEFLYKYSSDVDFREKTNEQVLELLYNFGDVYDFFGKEISKLSSELKGKSGGRQAEYQAGKVVVSVLGFVGGSGIIKSVNISGKISRRLRLVNKLKNIKIHCPPCFLLYKKSRALRKNLLSKENLPKVKTYLTNDWKKSGKTWSVFIKDYEAHHVIPLNLLDKSEGLQFYFNNGGKFRFNSIENGIMVKKVSKGGIHSNHPVYSRFLEGELKKVFNKVDVYNGDTKQKIILFDKELNKLVTNTKQIITEKSINGKIKINHIFK